MIKILINITLILILTTLLLFSGCGKDKIVESTEYVKEIEYVESPPDTIFQVDSIFVTDSVLTVDSISVYIVDTILISDTVLQVNNIYDTVQLYDTINIIDTVNTVQYIPNEFSAFSALEYYNNTEVLNIVYTELGLSDGWIFYLTSFQSDISIVSSDVYDIYGFIDYWAPDWSGYYPLEYYWRMTYNGGDPGDPNNWTMNEPPNAVADFTPGVRIVERSTVINHSDK
ncbi:hypothetical protein ACFLQG_00415 [Candidatus Zixiibacteriota bacterium]